MSEAGGALENVKEAFQGKRGKVLLIGGGIAIAGYVWWTRRNGTPETLPTDTTDTTDTTGDTGDTGTSPQSDPTVGNTSTGTTAGGTRKYANNADWLADGTSFLQGRGTPAGDAYNALTLALGGLPITAQQSAWVSQVIGALGAPPEGMPPLNVTAPAGTGSTQGNTPPPTTTPPKTTPPKTTPPKTTPAATYIAVKVVKYTTKSPPWNSTLSGIAGHYGKSWSTVWNDPKNASLRSKRKSPDKIQPGDTVYVKK